MFRKTVTYVTLVCLLAAMPIGCYSRRAVPVGEILPDYRSDTGENLSAAARRLASATAIRLRPDVSLQVSPQLLGDINHQG